MSIALLLLSLGAPTASDRGMVAAAHPLAAAAGRDILDAGGNAADAAVATAFALAVVEPYMSGLGGGGFALVRIGDEIAFMDFREVAPARATADMFIRDGKPDPKLSQDTILGAGVPGAVAGYVELHRHWGKLPRARVLQAAIALADKGFLVDGVFQEAIGWRLERLRADPEAARIFLVEGKPPPLGHRLLQKDLAAVLKTIAKEGAKPFYSGVIADKLAADAAARGGLIGKEDLARYEVRLREPLVGSYRGRTVVTSPPPSSGGTILLTLLNIMETLPAGTPWHDPWALHLYIEGSKRAFADRALLADPGHVAGVAELIPALTSKHRAAAVVKLIGQRATSAADVPAGQAAGISPPIAPLAAPERAHTTHLNAVDAAGNAVALTTTLNYGWGAAMVAKGTGVVWNDQMDDFAIAPGVPNVYGIVGSRANAVAPGKVPLSSMTPTFVFDGPGTDAPLRLVIGSPGGARIPTTVAQAIMLHLDHGADILTAISKGRVHHQHLPDVVHMEPLALEPATRAALAARGHALEVDEPWSNASGIAIDPATGRRTGAGDPRGSGAAAGQ